MRHARARPGVRRSGRRRILVLVVLLGSVAPGCDRDGEEPAPHATAASPAERMAALEARLAGASGTERGRLLAEFARLQLDAGHDDRALASAREAERLGVATAEVLHVAGESLHRRLDLVAARATLERAVASDPSHSGARRTLAAVLTRQGEFERAVALWEDLRDEGAPATDEIASLLDYGRALRGAGRRQDAADCFARVLENDPAETAAYSELAQTLYRMRLRREARFVEEIYQDVSQRAFEEHVGEGLARSGRVLFALGQRAYLRTTERRFLDAIRLYEEALALEEKDVRIAIHHATLCARFFRHREADAALEAALEEGTEPRSGVLFTRARLLLERKGGDEGERARAALPELEGARGALEREVDQGGEAKGQAPVLGLALVEAKAALLAGRLERAGGAVARAGKLAPDRWETHYWRGRVALQAGDLEAAERAFQDAERRDAAATFAELSYWYGHLLERLERRDDALLRYQTALRADLADTRPLAAIVPLLPPGASDTARAHDLLDEARRRESVLRDLEERIDRTPLTDCGPLYLEHARSALAVSPAAAVDTLFLAADLMPSNTEVRELLLRSLRHPSDTFRRVALLRRLLELDPGNLEAAMSLAGIELQLHVLLDDAEKLARRVHAARPSALSYRLLAEVLLRRERAGEALRLIEEGVKEHPNDSPLRDALERVRAAAG